MEDESAEWHVPNTAWVKGELLSTLDASAVDPRGLLKRTAHNRLFDRLSWFQRVQAGMPKGVPLVARAWNQKLHVWLFLNRTDRRKAISISTWYSMAFRPVFGHEADEGQKRILLTALARRIAKAKGAPAQIILAPVPRHDGSSDLVISCFGKGGWIALRRQSSTSWTANVAGMGFDGYWAARPGKMRSTLQRKSAKAGITTRILTAFDEDAWTAYESVYGDSWKPSEGNAAFLKDLARDEAAAGCLRLGIATREGEVVAAQFWTVENGVAYIHKLAHRETAREHSPGTILSAAMFRHVIDEDHVDTIDFGTGNDGYKADWMDRADPLDTIMLYNRRSLAGWLGAARTRLAALVRRTPLD